LGGAIDGVLAEYVTLHEDGVVHVPTHLSDEEAAALPCAAVTAWHALITEGNLKAGDTILVQGTGEFQSLPSSSPN
jgi:NADPH:quinone reductase-like Zn-dependent oxidoreductase